jgi:large conductance mechanosensitive channel
VIKGFKDFVLRGNVVELAVAVVIGAAFGSIVTAFTQRILQPLINAVTPPESPDSASRSSRARRAPTSTSRR